jgi:predicted nucleic acid-binding protein
MPSYADTSFLAAVYSPEPGSIKALAMMQRLRQPLPFTPFHRNELRNAIRLRVFRKEITAEQRTSALAEIDSDLREEILAHTPIPWTATFRQAEDLAAAHTEALGVRSFDLIHVGLALVLGATEFLTFDTRQAALAKAAGLKVKPQ